MASSTTSPPPDADAKDNDERPPPVPQPLFRLSIFKTLDVSHSLHGIMHQDYGQYHKYCTAKLRRLRRIRDVRSTLLHNPKYVGGKARKHSYCPREIPDVVEHPNVLLTLLYQSERAWAHACALQQQQQQQQRTTTTGGGSTKNKNSKMNRSHVLRRLRKASKWARLLEQKCKSSCVDETIQECQSYAAYMKANTCLEQKKYLDAFRSYKQSMTILLELANQIYTSSEDDTATNSQSGPGTLVLGDIWKMRAESVIRPLVRYCGYEAKDSIDPSELKEVTIVTTSNKATASGSSADGSIVLNFRGKQIALDSYKQIAVLYLKMEGSDMMAQQKDLDEDQFLRLLSDLDDASRLVQVELNRYGSSSTTSGPAVTAKRVELNALQAFFQYHKLIAWRRRQENLVVPTLSDDAEIVHVYDTLQQNAEAVANLLGGGDGDGEANDSNADYEEDPLWLEAQADVIRIRAFRCYYLAKLYESEPTLHGTTAQIIALLKHASKLGKRAQEEIAACFDDDDNEEQADSSTLEALENLDRKIGTMMCRIEATRFLASSSGDTGGNRNTDRPLWLRLDDLDAGISPTAKLADNPPLPIPMPCKPSFFDLAWQHVDTTMPLDDIEEYITSNVPKKQQGGGILSGWFGYK